MAKPWRQAACAVAVVGGVGHLRPGPGTWGSAVAAIAVGIIAVLVPAGLIQPLMIVATVIACGASLVCIPAAMDRFDNKDPSQVVIDEVAGVWIAAALLPGWILAAQPLLVALTIFVSFRVIDIAKPWPLPPLESIGGATGVLVDDLAAGVIAALATGILVL